MMTERERRVKAMEKAKQLKKEAEDERRRLVRALPRALGEVLSLIGGIPK